MIGYFQKKELAEAVAIRILSSQGFVYESSEPMKNSTNPRAIKAYNLAMEILDLVSIELNEVKETDDEEE